MILVEPQQQNKIYESLLLRLDLFLLEHYFIRYTMKQLVAVTKQGEI